MEPGRLAGSVLAVLTGIVLVAVGYWIWADERTDLVFAPGIDAPKSEIAATSGQVTVVAGGATVGLGLGMLLVVPEAAGWAVLLVPYTVICLGAAAWMRWRLTTQDRA